MSHEECYVPILKWKAGEKSALQHLTEDQKSKIIPIIEFTEYQEPKTVLDDFKKWYNHPIYIDTIRIDEGTGEYLTALINLSGENNEIFPVLYFDNFPELADELYRTTKRFLIRIPVPEDVDGADYSTIFSCITDWHTGKEVSLDIILDLGVVESKKDANLLYAELKNVLNIYVKKNKSFNKVIIAATSFPEDLSCISAGESIFFDRYDIVIFEKIFSQPNLASIKNRLVFSDYGVSKFTETELDFSKLKYGVLPKSKYTTPKKYWVLKGAKDHFTKTWIKDHKDIALEILNSRYFYGEDFSFGDLEIKERAMSLNGKGPGNHTNWVTIDTNHHISVVIEELSKIYGS
ncbi:MAG: beta family protein [Dehalobacter sp.]|nr:beta family protein [Dehalobacter sp.]